LCSVFNDKKSQSKQSIRKKLKTLKKIKSFFFSLFILKESTTPRLAWVVDDKCLCVCENYENKKIKKRRMKNLYRIPMLILVF